MKTIALIVLLTFTTSTCFAAGQPGIFFNISAARKLDADLKFYKEDAKTAKEKLTLIDKDRQLANTEVEKLKFKSTSLQEDLQIVIKAKDDYKNLYVKADDARLKAEENSPSRMTWFGVGFVSAAITGIIVLLLGGRR